MLQSLRTPPRILVLGFFAALLSMSAGCQRRNGPGAKAAHRTEGSRPTEVVHEECKLNGAETLDANGDGRADISIVKQGGRAVCQATDLNQDGIVDTYAYFAKDGKVRRREFAYSRDAQINEIRLYKGGQLAEIQQSTVAGGKLDTWHFFEGTRRVRTERDSNGDGVVDEWWEYPDKTRPQCPMMYSDDNGDAKPDPDSVVDLCKEGGYRPSSGEATESAPPADTGGDGAEASEEEGTAEPEAESEGGADDAE